MNDTHRELMGERGAELFLDLSGDDGKGLLHGVRAAHAILDESCHLPCEVVSYETKATTRQMNAIHKFTSLSERLMSSRSMIRLCRGRAGVPSQCPATPRQICPCPLSSLKTQVSQVSTNCPVSSAAARSHCVILF